MSNIGGLAAREFSTALVWWLAELRAMIPASLKPFLPRSPPGRLLEIGLADVTLSTFTPSEKIELWRAPLIAGDFGTGRIAPSNRPASEVTPVGSVKLSLPDGAVLRRRITLPATAARFLRRVISHELPFQTPFSVDQIYFDYRVLPAKRADGGISVEIALARRDDVIRAMQIADELELVPSQVLCVATLGEEGDDFDLLRDPNTRRAIDWVPLRAATLTVSAVLLLLGVVVGQTARVAQTQEVVTERLAEMRDQASSTEILRRRIDALEDRISYLPAQRQQIRPDRVLEELARVLPDDTWINHFTFDSGSVRIDGYSKSANKLIVLLDSSAVFQNAQFTAPTMAAAEPGSEQFEISLDAKNGTRHVPN